MDQALNSHAEASSGFVVALRRLARRFRAYRQHRRDMKSLAGLPDHILRDIGREDLIRPRNGPGVYGY